MEFNNLDGYSDAMDFKELERNLRKLYQDATAYAILQKEELLNAELNKINKIISHQIEESDMSWFNFQWAIKNPSLDAAIKQELLENYPFYKTALKAAEVAAAEFRESASKLLTICHRKNAA